MAVPLTNLAAALHDACGIGLRFDHLDTLLRDQPAIPWLEVLIDNYLLKGSVQQDYLLAVAAHYPLAFHGVGLSLGSVDPLNQDYLRNLARLINQVNPAWVSDHLCWTSAHGQVLHELMPLPYTDETVAYVAARIRQVQAFLGRELVLENVSSYLQYSQSNLTEWEFLVAVATEADCGLLLDVNNIYVSAYNHGFAAQDYLAAIPAERVREIHLAGHEDRGTHLLDTHSQPVAAPVWALYEQAIQQFGPKPTLIEWDNQLPDLAVLLAEAAKAQRVLDAAT